MKQLKHKMLVSTLATALTLGGTFTGIVHSAFADETPAAAAQSGSTADSGSAAGSGSVTAAPAASATGDSGAAAAATTPSAAAAAPSAPSAPAASPSSDDATIDGQSVPVFALLHGVDLSLGKAALNTAFILNEDLEDVYASLDAGSTLSQLGATVPGFNSQLLAPVQANLDDAVSKGNITAQQANQLSEYASAKLQQEINDSNYRDSDNWFGNVLAQRISANSDATAAITQFLGMSDDDLFADFQAGKSVAAIASDKGISEDQLIAELKQIPAANDLIWGPPVAVVSPDQSQPTVTDSTYSDN